MADDDKPKGKTDREILREFAHDIRTPLNAMLGFSSLLKGDLGNKAIPQEQVLDFAERMNAATRRLLQLTERALDQVVEGCEVVRKEDVDFTAFAEEIVRTFEVDAKAKGVTLSYAIADDFPILYTDPVVLFEVLSNLLSNAIKFTPKGGLVTVKGELDYQSNGLILVVQDTGKGIPATIMMGLMKGEAVTTSFAHTQHKGWGMGMGIVHEKVRLLGGAFEIQNAPNGGTVACIRMPND
ncbi:sensor histidine kinase [Pseudomonadota bacterium]